MSTVAREGSPYEASPRCGGYEAGAYDRDDPGGVMGYAVLAFVLTLVATAVAIAVLGRVGVLDVPNHRSSHSSPTVRGAGVGAGFAAVTALLLATARTDPPFLVVALASAAYAVLGLADDLRDLSVRYRLPLQVLVAVAAVVTAMTTRNALIVVLAAVFVVGYLNAFNFMDGINGISAFHAAGVGATWAAAGALSDVTAGVVLGGILIGAALGFLPFNFPRARGFLGDVGSYFFGGWIGVSALVLYGRVPLLVIVLPLTPYVADTGWTLLRRIRRGETWHKAHREHVYQRLTAAGWSHARSAGLVGGLTLASGAGALVASYGVESAVATGAMVLFVAILLLAYLALPEWMARSEREHVAA